LGSGHFIGAVEPQERGLVRALASEEGGMTDKNTGQHALSALVAKRAEIAGKISVTRTDLRQLIADLDHVDAAIRLFAPDYDVEAIRPRTYPVAQVTRRGELVRMILDILRETAEPLTTQQVALRVMATRGLNTKDDALIKVMTRRCGASLRNYRDSGTVKSIKDGRYGKYDLWELAK
jgi:hypothetical protein